MWPKKKPQNKLNHQPRSTTSKSTIPESIIFQEQQPWELQRPSLYHLVVDICPSPARLASKPTQSPMCCPAPPSSKALSRLEADSAPPERPFLPTENWTFLTPKARLELGALKTNVWGVAKWFLEALNPQQAAGNRVEEQGKGLPIWWGTQGFSTVSEYTGGRQFGGSSDLPAVLGFRVRICVQGGFRRGTKKTECWRDFSAPCSGSPRPH